MLPSTWLLAYTMISKIALIAGITGQDGAYLAEHLLRNDYKVFGTSRDVQACNTFRLKCLGIQDDVELLSLVPGDFRSVLRCLSDVSPDEVYNLSGQTSVGLSFEQPVESMESIAGGTLNFLEAIRFLGSPCRFFNAGSSECFGDTGLNAAVETSPFNPRSPYAVAKCAAYWQVASYRDAYGLYCCTGLLSNHESPFRANRFVTQKIISSVKSIRDGRQKSLCLGNLDVWRDWGWAPDYVQAMHMMLQQDNPADFIVSTGVTSSLRDFVDVAFNAVGLDSAEYITTDSRLFRPSDIKYSALDPSNIANKLGWRSSHDFAQIIESMIAWDFSD